MALVAALAISTPAEAWFWHKPKPAPVKVEQQPPKAYVPVPTAPKPVTKPQTWKDTAKQIGRGGLITLGINGIVWGARIGLALVGLPVF